MTEFERGLHPGATWRKCDFQVHTPRDAGWVGSPHLPGGSPEHEDARLDWARQLVAECERRGITAIAITDHHDYAFVSYVQEAAEERRRREPAFDLWVFPGLEVTCDDDVQCLVLVDVGAGDLLNRILSKHDLPRIDTNAAMGPSVRPCGARLEEFIRTIAEDTYLEPRTLVLPHAGPNGAHKSVLAGEHTRFASLPSEGVYVEVPYSALNDATRDKIYGKIQEWGTRRRGIIPTGDNKKADFARLGAHSCWIRLGEPTVEAIRQALLVDEARLSYTGPQVPTHRIISMTVRSKLTGEIKLIFNDGLNAIIGGRGTGKSALLEYLRFGLGISSVDFSVDNDSTDSVAQEEEGESFTISSGRDDRVRKLLLDTLDEVIIQLERNNVIETWTRTLKNWNLIRVTIDGGETFDVTPAIARERFPARGYQQKQLSGIVSDANAAGNQVTTLAAAEFVGERKGVERLIEEARAEIDAAVQRLASKWRTEAELALQKRRLADVARQIIALNQKITAAGLSPETQEILKKAPEYQSVESYHETLCETLQSEIDELETIVDDILSDVPVAPSIVSATELADVVQLGRALQALGSEVRATINASISKLKDFQKTVHKAVKEFDARNKEFKKEHARALAEQQQHKALLESIAKLTNEARESRQQVQRIETQLRSYDKAEDVLDKARKKLAGGVALRSEILKRAARRTSEVSGNRVNATVRRRTSNNRECADALEGILDRTGVVERALKVRNRLRAMADNFDMEWSAIGTRLLALFRQKLLSVAEPVEDAEQSKLLDELEKICGFRFTSTQADHFIERLDEQRVSRVLQATYAEYIEFEYQHDGGTIPFERASPGQRAAALLFILLEQDAGTLIIDQPEDDLDNRAVMDLVARLRTAKQRRQMIFATHNPNFVVNGDADKVIALGMARAEKNRRSDEPQIQIEVDGAIETRGVREAITTTLEGGEDAFKLRGRKYDFNVG